MVVPAFSPLMMIICLWIIVFLPVYLKTVSRYPDMNVAIDHIVEEGTRLYRGLQSPETLDKIIIRQGRCQSC